MFYASPVLPDDHFLYVSEIYSVLHVCTTKHIRQRAAKNGLRCTRTSWRGSLPWREITIWEILQFPHSQMVYAGDVRRTLTLRTEVQPVLYRPERMTFFSIKKSKKMQLNMKKVNSSQGFANNYSINSAMLPLRILIMNSPLDDKIMLILLL